MYFSNPWEGQYCVAGCYAHGSSMLFMVLYGRFLKYTLII